MSRVPLKRRVTPRLILVSLALIASLALLAASAAAATPSPAWTVDSLTLPTNFSSAADSSCRLAYMTNDIGSQPDACNEYEVTIANAGSVPTDGSTITITDTLPAGVTLRPIAGGQPVSLIESQTGSDLGSQCTAVAQTVTCQVSASIRPDNVLELDIFTYVNPGTTGSLPNSTTVAGGGAPSAFGSVMAQISAFSPGFGVAGFSAYIAGPGGQPDTQAGDHPYELTTRIDLNNLTGQTPTGGTSQTAVEDPKDVVVDLPLGFMGSAVSAPRCTFAALAAQNPIGAGISDCPPDSQVGTLTSETFYNVGYPVPQASNQPGNGIPIYNMTPEKGVAAEFGYQDPLRATHVLYARVVPSPAGYVVQVTSRDIPEVPITNIAVAFFGNPSARDGNTSTPSATFTNPSDCNGQPLVTKMFIDSWQHPGRLHPDGTPDLSDPNWVSASATTPPVTGCEKLRFQSSISLQPDTTVADSPSGVHVDIKVPQSEDPNAPATPPLKDASVTLPPGFTVDPSSADGLGACSPPEIALDSAASPTCPDNSKIGSVELKTPLIPGTLTGSIYLATQFDNPFHSLLAAYIVVDDPTTGVVVKIPGNLTPDPNTGQLTGVFDNNPQFPFSELKLDFKGGSGGVLATPQSCGTFTSNASFSPWSAPDSGPDATPSSSLNITSNCGLRFAPSFSVGTENPQAGAFSPLTLTVARQDGEQHLTGLTVTTPPGVLGSLTGIPLCPEAQANAGTCAEASRIGETTVSSGVGPNPFVVKGGRVYLTGPYNGGPFGMSVVIPAVAGPFNLGNVVVRSSIRINPITSQITVVSDPLPTMINSVEGLQSGIPADIRTVNVTINRPNFTFNATDCNPLEVTGMLSGANGGSESISNHYQAANCANLKFEPTVSVVTAAHSTRSNGASLKFNVAYPKGAMGHATWFNEAKFTIPKQFPARLTTLQKACLAEVYETERQNCPKASRIGTAVVHTEVLPVPLEGPVYFVSYGGAKFPDAVLDLRGDNVHIELHGNTLIAKGVTSATFRNTPDVPFESIEVSLPTGPFSEFGSFLPHESHDFCGRHLSMPTFFKASNGAEINEKTPVQVTGCSSGSSNSQKLASALRACHKKHGKKRASCENAARKKYGKAARAHHRGGRSASHRAGEHATAVLASLTALLRSATVALEA